MNFLKEISYGTFKDLGSTFESALIPLASPEDLKSAQEEFIKAFPKADHYPYAYRYEGLSRSSDDGEPSGTGGRALLSLLENKELDCCLLIVARYFGGTKLGIPRLRRAFVSSASEAIEHAKRYEKKEAYVYHLELSYSQYETLRKNQTRYDYELSNTSFDVNVITDLVSFATIEDPFDKMGLDKNLLSKMDKQIHLVEVLS